MLILRKSTGRDSGGPSGLSENPGSLRPIDTAFLMLAHPFLSVFSRNLSTVLKG